MNDMSAQLSLSYSCMTRPLFSVRHYHFNFKCSIKEQVDILPSNKYISLFIMDNNEVTSKSILSLPVLLSCPCLLDPDWLAYDSTIREEIYQLYATELYTYNNYT